ncbi:MAG: hypothetical protein RSA99_03050 [Oscillospiraceae bacterium]
MKISIAKALGIDESGFKIPLGYAEEKDIENFKINGGALVTCQIQDCDEETKLKNRKGITEAVNNIMEKYGVTAELNFDGYRKTLNELYA